MYDPTFKSCTKYICTVARDRFGFDAPDLAELVNWADIIDGAQYTNAQEAVELREPAMRLTLVIEGASGSEIVRKDHPHDAPPDLAAIMADPEIAAIYKPLHERHLRSIDIIREQAQCDDGVVYFDLVDDGMEGYNKFIPYYLFPQATYTVSVSTSSFRTKVSVGSNPWADKPVNVQSRLDLRALRRRRTPQGRRDQLPDRRGRRSSQSRRRNRSRVAHALISTRCKPSVLNEARQYGALSVTKLSRYLYPIRPHGTARVRTPA